MKSSNCTGESNGLFEKKASKFPTTRSFKSLEDSSVKAAECGENTTLSNSSSSSGTLGSCSKTSNPAPAIFPSCKNCTNAFSSMMAPRAALIITPCLPSAWRTSLLIR
ncbi:unnamed protein product [Coffea canephora]|uniref:DH200=94 genomic scaffold, scaffold_1376 n=1 Tax=Coffea canephora TaxID=49390 RepID=A0A068VIC6_COFCA|nr:unnamed protein product [Coffea canephora]